MRLPRIEIGPGAALPAALLLLLLRTEELTALLLPVAVHELGHWGAVLALGLSVTELRAGFGGLQLRYTGETETPGHVLISASGPLAGLLYALAVSWRGTDWRCLSAGLSLALSALNLLPILPLDGGQILLRLCCALAGEERGERIARAVGLTGAALLCCGGLALLLRSRGIGLLLLGLLLLFQNGVGRGL